MAKDDLAPPPVDTKESDQPKMSKRRCVPSACVPCRKRKSKCDGGTPICATCTAVYKTSCYYDAESDGRRKAASKRERSDSLERRAESGSRGASDAVIDSLRTLPDSDVFDIIQRLRADEDLETICQALRSASKLSNTAEGQAPEEELSSYVGKQVLAKSGVSRAFGHTSGLGLVPEDESSGEERLHIARVDNNSGTWTAVTKDKELVCHLLRLYFTWSHPFYSLLNEPTFWADFEAGRTTHCSSLLVNCICAYASHFSDRPACRTDPSNPRTAGDHFFAEARRLLFLDETPSVTAVQALGILALREPSAGRDSSGFMYMGRCLRMALELGIHLNWTSMQEAAGTAEEIEQRKTTSWGSFILDTACSVCIGRICQIPRAAITVPKPTIATGRTKQQDFWEPYTDSYDGSFRLPRQPDCFQEQVAAVSELANDLVYMFYAPRERLTSRKVLDCYYGYQRWYAALPKSVQLDLSAEAPAILPEIYVLHMFYHTCVLHLFRPLIRVDIRNSQISPRDMCFDSAAAISDLAKMYQKHYSLRHANVVLCHIVFSATVVHLLNSGHSDSMERALQGLQDLETLSEAHYFAARAFKIVITLSEKWNITIPEDRLRFSKLMRQRGPISPTSVAHIDGPTAISTSQHPLDVEANADRTSANLVNHGASAFTGQHGVTSASKIGSTYDTTTVSRNQQSTLAELDSLSDQKQFHRTSNAATSSKQPLPAASVSQTPAEQLFWSPFALQGRPIMAPAMNLSPMDLSTMLGSVNEWDQLYRDGFTLNEKIASEFGHDNINVGSSDWGAQGLPTRNPPIANVGLPSSAQWVPGGSGG